MLNNILVTYATLYGSTQEVAESIAATLRRKGFIVEVHDAKKVTNVEGYDAVVLGAPLYVGRWLKEAHTFLDSVREQLVLRPIAIFSLGPIGKEETEMTDAISQMEKEIAKHTWLKPVASEMFIGKYDPDKLGFAHKLLARIPGSPLHDLPKTDYRDWDAIETWAEKIALQLEGEPA